MIELTSPVAKVRHRKHFAAGVALVMPCLLVLGTVFFFPIVNLLAFSLHPYDGPAQVGQAFTTENYSNMLTDSLTARIMLNTFALGFAVLLLVTVLAYPVAYCLARTESRFRGIFVFFVISPLLISAVVRNLGWFPILSSSGVVNWLLTASVFSEPVPMINTFFSVTVALAHALLPLLILTLYTVIQRIDPEIEYAAVSLGAHPFVAFIRITLPLTRPGLVGGGLLVFSIAISAFTTPAFMGGNKVVVMATYIAQQVQSALDYAIASVASVILIIAGLITALIALSLQRVVGEQK